MKDLLIKLRKERMELTGKISNLEKFRGSKEWNELSVYHKELLDIQLNAMRTYREVLIGRCIDIEMNLDKEDKSKENEIDEHTGSTENNKDSIRVFIVNLGEDKDE